MRHVLRLGLFLLLALGWYSKDMCGGGGREPEHTDTPSSDSGSDADDSG